MSMPAGQQRLLNEIESALQASEPHLASMFAIFARLNSGEPVRAEPVRTRRWLGTPLYALVVIPLMFAAIIAALLGGTAHSAAACGSAAKPGTSYKAGARQVGGASCLVPADTAFRNAGPPARTMPVANTPAPAGQSCLTAREVQPAALTAAGPAPPATTPTTPSPCYK